MNRRRLGACAVLCAVVSAGAAAAAAPPPPRLTLSATSATWGDEVVVNVKNAPRGGVRLYLAPRAGAASIRSRLDARLSFIGSTRGRLRFTVPPLESGAYALAYWCRGCAVRVLRSPMLRVVAPLPGPCAVTKPNGRVPPGAARPSRGWEFHGNGGLWALLPPNATYERPAAKIPWVAHGVQPWRRLQVKYRRLDVPSPTLSAVTVSGTLGGYDGPSWASRMAFEPGCWHVSGRVLDASLSFVVQVEDD